VIRGCAGCDQSDSHPRHVVGVVNRQADPPTPRHIDCCAATGCAACADTVARSGGKTGQALIDHLAAERAARTEEN
jgi:hypothetical protein